MLSMAGPLTANCTAPSLVFGVVSSMVSTPAVATTGVGAGVLGPVGLLPPQAASTMAASAATPRRPGWLLAIRRASLKV
jgi:hypothetical protein